MRTVIPFEKPDIDKYCARLSVSDSTKRRRKSQILAFKQWLRVNTKRITLLDVTYKHLRRYNDHLIEHFKPSTARQHFNALKNYYTWLYKTGHDIFIRGEHLKFSPGA